MKMITLREGKWLNSYSCILKNENGSFKNVLNFLCRPYVLSRDQNNQETKFLQQTTS